MSEFVTAAVAEAPAAISQVTKNELARLFLSGGEGSSGDYHVVGRNLYEESKIVARLCPDGTVLLPTENIDDTEFNDALVGQLFAGGRTFRRVPSFDNLASAKDRLADLKNGNIDSLRSIGSLFGLNVDPEAVANYQRAAAFEKKITDFFTSIESAEKKRVAAAEAAARKARVAAAAIAWDSGEGPATNHNVHGHGGEGQRLRVSNTPKRSGGRSYVRVETSTGQTTTLTQAQRAFAIATKYWHGGERIGHHYQSHYISGSRRVDVHEDRLKFGCQTVYRKEAERFADSQGWPQAKPAA